MGPWLVDEIDDLANLEATMNMRTADKFRLRHFLERGEGYVLIWNNQLSGSELMEQQIREQMEDS